MDASGIVVAASEVIKFEKGWGIIFTIYNICMDFHFYILAKDNLIDTWKKIYVNHFYKFSHLKLAAVEWLSGSVKFVLLATSKSEFHEIFEHQSQKCDISRNLIKRLSIPGIKFKSEINCISKLISYQGVVTKVENSKLGIYKLDNKIQLYCIFNSLRALLPVLKEGFEVFISNAHYFTDFTGRKILVCCGLSSVRCTESEGENADITLSIDFCQYSLSIFDIIWLEMLFTRLNINFCPSVISTFIFHWESKIMNNILEQFSNSCEEASCTKRQSLGEEYCSNPHSCSIFCDDILPTGCEILSISEILDEAFSKISWIENSDHWKTCSVDNQTKYILIGMLYLSKNGCWFVMDKSCNVPIVLTRCCCKCKFLKNIFCSFDNLNIGYLIAVQNFDVVFEKIMYKYGNNYCYRYLKTSCCYLFHLGTFCKQKDSSFLPVRFDQECFNLQPKQDSSIEITGMLKNINLDKQDLSTDIKENSCNGFHNEDLANNNLQYVLVLNKIWTITGQTFVCYQILVLFLPQEEVFEDYFDRSKSIFEDNPNFYETEDDDEEFAELVNQMDSLFLDDKPRLARLHFESTKQCALMLPGHMYVIDFADKFVKDEYFSFESNLKPLLVKIKPSVKIVHHLECLGDHQADDYEADIYCSIKQIISERKVRDNCLIRAILKDKLYEEPSTTRGSQNEVDGNVTFCLILKDCSSDDTIKVYLPFCPKNIYGFLPGIWLQMYGFVCVCSKRGNLYLTNSSSFGIQVMNLQDFHRPDDRITKKAEKASLEDKLKISSLRSVAIGDFFKCVCYIIKIVSAKLYLMCNSCESEFEKKCPCLCNYSIKLSMSFVIDDGIDQVLVFCSDETARKVLMLTENEWKKLTLHVTETMTSLRFHYKRDDNDCDASSLINRVFSVYCSSKSLCRQICLKCRKKSDVLKSDQPTAWCCDILHVNEIDLIPEFIAAVKSIDAENIQF